MIPSDQAGLPTPEAPEDGAPPMGVSPATGPTPNSGMEMKGEQGVALILDAAAELLPMVGAASQMGQLLLDFIKKGSRLVQPGAVSPAGKQNQIEDMMRRNAQNGANMQMVRQGLQPQPGAQQPPAAA